MSIQKTQVAAELRKIIGEETPSLLRTAYSLARGDFPDEEFNGSINLMKLLLQLTLPKIEMSDDPINVALDKYPPLEEGSELRAMVEIAFKEVMTGQLTVRQGKEFIASLSGALSPYQKETLGTEMSNLNITLTRAK